MEEYLPFTNFGATGEGEDDQRLIYGAGKWGLWVLGCDRVGLDFSMEKRALQAETLPGEIQSYSFTSTIWRGFVPPRIELFTWFVLVGKATTKDCLCRLGVPDSLKQHFENWTNASRRKMDRKRQFGKKEMPESQGSGISGGHYKQLLMTMSKMTRGH
ncbi:hypothetical protein AHAS_Ahas16G0075600 [Arachis hypogaea]